MGCVMMMVCGAIYPIFLQSYISIHYLTKNKLNVFFNRLCNELLQITSVFSVYKNRIIVIFVLKLSLRAH
jgi:hypothetical protein